jgi:hypothetical protein
VICCLTCTGAACQGSPVAAMTLSAAIAGWICAGAASGTSRMRLSYDPCCCRERETGAWLSAGRGSGSGNSRSARRLLVPSVACKER